MTDEERSLIAYRISRAHEAIEEAGILFDAGHFNSYVNRLYYACFYATSAWLLTRNLSTSKHGYLRLLLQIEPALGRHGLLSATQERPGWLRPWDLGLGQNLLRRDRQQRMR